VKFKLANPLLHGRFGRLLHITDHFTLNDSQKAAWTKVTEVFDPVRQQTRALALYPADRAVPVHATDCGVQVRLDQFELRRPLNGSTSRKISATPWRTYSWSLI
jgi:hypothetical protein